MVSVSNAASMSKHELDSDTDQGWRQRPKSMPQRLSMVSWLPATAQV